MFQLTKRRFFKTLWLSLIMVVVVMLFQAVGFWVIHAEVDETPQDITALGDSREFWIYGIASAALI